MCLVIVAVAESDLRRLIIARSRSLGFDQIGFAAASLTGTQKAALRSYLAAGHHGSMGWMQDRADERADPQILWPDAVSVISLGLSYAPPGDALATTRRPLQGNISVYARGRDYHDIIKGKLKHLAQFIVGQAGAAVKVFVDTAPLMEKPLAQNAGLGWQGKHTNLVSRQNGSWLLLGEILTTLAIAPDVRHRDHCGSCSNCLDVCPTQAFVAPYKLDARRCISYLTIEHQGPIEEGLRAGMGNRIYGCDDCLAVCPWNKFAAAGREAKLAARPDLVAPDLAKLARLDDAGFRGLFSASPIKRIGRVRFARNVAIAIGNSADAGLMDAAYHLAGDDDAVVAEAGAWAVGRLAGDAARALS